METLIIKRSLNGDVYLCDAYGHKLSWFISIEAASKWAKENGYDVRVEL